MFVFLIIILATRNGLHEINTQTVIIRLFFDAPPAASLCLNELFSLKLFRSSCAFPPNKLSNQLLYGYRFSFLPCLFVLYRYPTTILVHILSDRWLSTRQASRSFLDERATRSISSFSTSGRQQPNAWIDVKEISHKLYSAQHFGRVC